MLDAILDGVIDTVKIVPFLFISFFIIEILEHKFNSNKKLEKAGKFGPLFGSLLGIVPQCGIASIATNLYVTGIISVGTLISVFLSTSDEMIPILLSENVSLKFIFIVLAIKFLVGVASGLIIDLFYQKKNTEDYSLCEEEHCHCEEHIFISALKHTVNISLFILVVNILLNLIFSYGLEDLLSNLLLSDSIFSPFITSLIGLIPNCASSIIITKLYLVSSISFGSLIAGLLTNSGIALIILAKTNKNKKENLTIILLTYLIGVLVGIILNIFKVAF
ncbi:MAG: putative manganese transporter [bacterium]|nr:putative manganese transporter [bacterium]